MINRAHVIDREILHGHLFCGLGGGAKGFNKSNARVGTLRAKFRCVGGVDVDPAAIADFTRAAGVPGTVLDLFSREQYVAFWGKEPPPGWRPAVPDDIRRAYGNERPHILFLSAPCKGFSGLLAESLSKSAKYQALNGLTLRGMWLVLEAYKDDPIDFILFENVPRIAKRGRHLLDQIVALLRSYGYAVAETTHDCGELGGLGQSRKRFLLVARHVEKVPPFLYEPPKRPLRGVGEIIGRLPVPGPDLALPMHRMPALQWKTWVRLAFVEAGADWRSLNRLSVQDGVLADYGIAPDTSWHAGVLGVREWTQSSVLVAGGNSPTNGAYSVADPRIDGHAKSVQMGVGPWEQTAATIKGDVSVGTGRYAVADPRISGRPLFNNVFRIASRSPGSGALVVADHRPGERADYKQTKYRVTGYEERSGAVIGASTTGNGAFAVADPRPDCLKQDGDHYQSGGHYGVVPWERYSNAVSGSALHDNGFNSVADPRLAEGAAAYALPSAADRLVCCIRAMDGTWHRPFTTLELAALQSLVEPEETLELEGLSDSAWRERIGNAVPPDAAEVIGSSMGRTLLAAWSGQIFMLSSEPIWVRPIAIAASVRTEGLVDL